MRGGGFVEFVLDQLRPWGDVVARRMFSGQGIFRDGVMFALVQEDTLYFRADGRNVPDFEAAGTRPFSYRRGARSVALGYWAVPADALDEGDRLAQWADKAYAAALARPRRGRGRGRKGQEQD